MLFYFFVLPCCLNAKHLYRTIEARLGSFLVSLSPYGQRPAFPADPTAAAATADPLLKNILLSVE